MKAWQYVGDGEPITLNEVPEPVAGPGEVVLDVKAAGVCHTDVGHVDGVISYLLHAAEGEARTMGHEIAGIVREVGEGVTDRRVGDRVVVRAAPEGPGTERDGGFAPLVSVQQELLVPLPDGVPWDQAAVATDGGMTSYHAVGARAEASPGLKLGLIGYGGLGSLGVQTALGRGAVVYVAEVREDRFPEILAAGVTDVATSVDAFADVGLDVIVDFAGFGTTTAQAIKTVRGGGRVVLVGLGAQFATIDSSDLVMRQIELVGSMGGDNEDVAQVLQLMLDGKLVADTAPVTFDKLGDAVDRLRDGTNVGRAVILFD